MVFKLKFLIPMVDFATLPPCYQPSHDYCYSATTTTTTTTTTNTNTNTITLLILYNMTLLENTSILIIVHLANYVLVLPKILITECNKLNFCVNISIHIKLLLQDMDQWELAIPLAPIHLTSCYAQDCHGSLKLHSCLPPKDSTLLGSIHVGLSTVPSHYCQLYFSCMLPSHATSSNWTARWAKPA